MSVFEKIESAVTKNLQEKIKRANLLPGFINRVIYPMYQNAQRIRWVSQNTSEGTQWPALNQKYEQSKLKRFASFPGGGSKMMIATSRLFNSVTGDSLEDHRKVIDDTSLSIFTAVDYADNAGSVRDFSHFSRATLNEMRQKFADYVAKGRQ